MLFINICVTLYGNLTTFKTMLRTYFNTILKDKVVIIIYIFYIYIYIYIYIFNNKLVVRDKWVYIKISKITIILLYQLLET